ncbi:MAG TPA: YqgE/AlgH family protein [Anaeromyxobacteraceae bacterium]|nr:YqgE/AlgH family protein [Anaeromyxobacteraceae bacterium]
MGSSATSGSLAPGFLVAAPALADPNFDGSLVLMARHGPEGALGFVVNRVAPVSTADVLAAVDGPISRAARAAGRDSGAVLLGGPVRTEQLWVLCRPSALPPGEDFLAVGSGLALGGSREILEAVATAPDRSPFLLFLGYSGWGPLQVEHEVGAGAWVPMPLHEDLVLDVPLDARYDEAVRRLGLTPGGFTVGGGGAQA